MFLMSSKRLKKISVCLPKRRKSPVVLERNQHCGGKEYSEARRAEPGRLLGGGSKPPTH